MKTHYRTIPCLKETKVTRHWFSLVFSQALSFLVTLNFWITLQQRWSSHHARESTSEAEQYQHRTLPNKKTISSNTFDLAGLQKWGSKCQPLNNKCLEYTHKHTQEPHRSVTQCNIDLLRARSMNMKVGMEELQQLLGQT